MVTDQQQTVSNFGIIYISTRYNREAYGIYSVLVEMNTFTINAMQSGDLHPQSTVLIK